MADSSACACGSGRTYLACCQPLHAGMPADDAEALMRSRYSAYVLGLSGYLLASWHADTRPQTLGLDEVSSARTTWLGLEVRQHLTTGEHSAEVEFVARYRRGGSSAVRLHERSRFMRECGHWFYVDGQHL